MLHSGTVAGDRGIAPGICSETARQRPEAVSRRMSRTGHRRRQSMSYRKPLLEMKPAATENQHGGVFAWAGPEFGWTVDWENLKRRNQSYVHIKEERFWRRRGSRKDD
jgi:hypothetical protein